jgi:hypothetical protein
MCINFRRENSPSRIVVYLDVILSLFLSIGTLILGGDVNVPNKNLHLLFLLWINIDT